MVLRIEYCRFVIFVIIAVIYTFQPVGVSCQNTPQQSNDPFTYLWDTASSSPMMLQPETIPDKQGWIRLEEDDLTHRFSGDAVLSNDRLAVVFRKDGFGAELYSLTANGPVFRAFLALRNTAKSASGMLSSITISENNPGAVQIDAVFRFGKGTMKAGFRLTTGEVCIEIHPGQTVEKLFVGADTRYTIVPDYFGDDMIFSAESFQGDLVYLPTEKFILDALGHGDAMMMCVWESSRQSARVLLSEYDGERVIYGSEIQCLDGGKIWIALMEKPGIWFEGKPSGKETKSDTALDWKPPFPAKWRANILYERGLAASLPLTEDFIRTQSGKPFLIYAFDRNRTTPLSQFCPIDIMRNTLGVGPCQYILDVEGLASEDHPTPNQVTEWIEKQFERKREKRYRESIEERLKAMAALMAQSQERVRQYEAFARELITFCAKEEKAGMVQELLSTIGGIEDSIAAKSGEMKRRDEIERLTGKIVELIGRDNAVSPCQTFCASIRSTAAACDSVLSRCRMKTRWLKQQCVMAAARHPEQAEFLNEIRERAERFLQEK